MIRFLFSVFAVLLVGCAAPADDYAQGDDAHDHGDDAHAHGGEEESWAVTAWGDHYEIFAEADPLLAGQVSKSHTHVTILDGFKPLREGVVSIILRGADGTEVVFRQTEPLRDGIFDVAIEPARPGDYELRFRVEFGGRNEEIPAGRVRVGDHHGGGLLDDGLQTSAGGDVVSFLKEQQWRTTFATAWAESASVRTTLRGPGRVRPRAGGEVVLSASQDGLVTGDPWPHPGRRVRQGEAVFRLMPLVSGDRSLAELQATVTGLRAELEPARARLGRLEGLLRVEATSEGEVAAARGHVASLEARLDAAERDLATAGAARRGGGAAGESIALEAPFTGSVSQVLATRGEVVTAGQPLGRVIETDPLWVEVAVRPGDVPLLEGDSYSLHIHGSGGAEGVTFTEDRVRFVSRSPEVDPATGTVALLLEVAEPGGRIIPGSAVTVEVGLPVEREGIVIPESAVVDDAGVPVVYAQDSGEEFVRREIGILARHGDELLVSGIPAGLRVVTQGGAAIRRATLVSSGDVQGHVH